MIKWRQLTQANQLIEVKKASFQRPVIIYKHSTRCSISSMVLHRLERSWEADAMETLRPYFLDLITFRELSDAIATFYGVRHESPQLLLIFDGKCNYHSSHGGINYLTLKNLVQTLGVS